MTDSADAIEPTLRVTKNGPYVVTGEVRLTDHLGVQSALQHGSAKCLADQSSTQRRWAATAR